MKGHGEVVGMVFVDSKLLCEVIPGKKIEQRAEVFLVLPVTALHLANARIFLQ